MPAPKSLRCGATVMGLALHPHEDLAVTGLVDGSVEFWRYNSEIQAELDASDEKIEAIDDDDNGKKSKKPQKASRNSKEDSRRVNVFKGAHKDACRVACFSSNASPGSSSSSSSGQTASVLVTGGVSKDLKAWDVANGKVFWTADQAHGAAVNSVHSLERDDLFVSGDEEGEIKIWDLRQASSKAALSTVKDHEDYISDMVVDGRRKTLVTASGDSTLGVYDLKMAFRKLKLKDRSVPQDDDILSLQVVRGGSKLVAGTQEGVLSFWSWGAWGDVSDRYPGHPESIDCILGVDDSTIITGSSDGMMRVLTIYPHKLVGVLGDHMDFPIERLSWTHDRMAIASSSHDEIVRFWDASVFLEGSDDEDDEDDSDDDSDDDDDDDDDTKPKTVVKSGSATKRKSGAKSDDEDSDGDDDDDDDDGADDDNQKVSKKDDSDDDDDDDSDGDDDKASGKNPKQKANVGDFTKIKTKNKKGQSSASISHLSKRARKTAATGSFYDDM